MITTDRASFDEWFKSFIQRRKGLVPMKEWFDLVEKAHQPIREFLGGVRKTVCVELENQQSQVPFSQIYGITNELLATIPEYFYSHADNRSMFQTPLIVGGQFDGMKRGRHVQHWMSKKKVTDEVQNRVNVLMSNLGKLWSQNKTNKRKLYATITTDPRAFAQLGYYGPDHESCFKQGGCNQHHKYVLGSNKGTYVVLVGSSEDLEYSNTCDVVARFWGVTNDSHDIWSVANYYPKPAEKEGDIFNCVDQLFSQILQVEKASRHEFGLKIEPIFQNKVVNWCYTKPDFKYTGFYAGLSWNGLDDMVYCSKCNKQQLSCNTTLISGNRICCLCEENLKVCEYTGRKTLGDLTEAINEDGKIIKIGSEAISSGDFKVCNISYKYCHKKLIVCSSVHGHISKKAADDRGLKVCIKCKLYNHWKDIENDVCRWCVGKGTNGWTRKTITYDWYYSDKEPIW